jgi:hypothetical protein
VGSGVPKACNTYEENVAKWTQNTDFLQNLTTEQCFTFKQTFIEIFIEIWLCTKESSAKILSELHM